MIVAGIVLAGGKGTRMGRDKATLSFGPESLVQRLVRVLGEAVSPLVVAAAASLTSANWRSVQDTIRS